MVQLALVVLGLVAGCSDADFSSQSAETAPSPENSASDAEKPTLEGNKSPTQKNEEAIEIDEQDERDSDEDDSGEDDSADEDARNIVLSESAHRRIEPIQENQSVEAFCDDKSSRLQELTIIMSFPEDNITCEWGRNGNMRLIGPFISAQQEYMKTIDIGEDVASLCSFTVDMKEEFTRYDDDITFVFDGYAFAGDYLGRNFLAEHLQEENGLLVYDRLKIIGKRFPSEQQWREDGIEGSFNTRQNSRTEREGSFDLQLTQSFVDRMSREKLTNRTHTFGFYISGNSHTSDCQHAGFQFTATIQYIPR